jgi:hypothetical protein
MNEWDKIDKDILLSGICIMGIIVYIWIDFLKEIACL